MKRKRLFWICLIIFSLLLNIVLILKHRQQFIRLRSPRSAFYYCPTPQTRSENSYILFLGDSRIQQWKPLPDFKETQVLNLGCSGAISSDLLEQVKRMEYPKNIRMAILEIGINDLTVIAMTPRRKEIIISECKSNITEVVGILRQRNIPVVLLPVLPAGRISLARRLVWSREIDSAIGDVNRHLSSLQIEGVTLMDCSEMIGTDGRIYRQYAKDTLHLSAKGYEKLNGIILSSLDNPLNNEDH